MTTSQLQLPVIDVQALRHGSAAERQAVAAQLGQACETHGFFYISGHGIDPALIDGVFAGKGSDLGGGCSTMGTL